MRHTAMPTPLTRSRTLLSHQRAGRHCDLHGMHFSVRAKCTLRVPRIPTSCASTRALSTGGYGGPRGHSFTRSRVSSFDFPLLELQKGVCTLARTRTLCDPAICKIRGGSLLVPHRDPAFCKILGLLHARGRAAALACKRRALALWVRGGAGRRGPGA